MVCLLDALVGWRLGRDTHLWRVVQEGRLLSVHQKGERFSYFATWGLVEGLEV